MRTTRFLARGLAVLVVATSASAATISLTGAGDSTNASGTVSFSIRNNETTGSYILDLAGADLPQLKFSYEWFDNWLWFDFTLPNGGFVETSTVHREVPFFTAPSTGFTTGTRTLTLGSFTSSFAFRFDEYLMTGTGTWQLGAGAAQASTVPDRLPGVMIAAMVCSVLWIHRRKPNGGGLSP